MCCFGVTLREALGILKASSTANPFPTVHAGHIEHHLTLCLVDTTLLDFKDFRRNQKPL